MVYIRVHAVVFSYFLFFCVLVICQNMMKQRMVSSVSGRSEGLRMSSRMRGMMRMKAVVMKI